MTMPSQAPGSASWPLRTDTTHVESIYRSNMHGSLSSRISTDRVCDDRSHASLVRGERQLPPPLRTTLSLAPPHWPAIRGPIWHQIRTDSQHMGRWTDGSNAVFHLLRGSFSPPTSLFSSTSLFIKGHFSSLPARSRAPGSPDHQTGNRPRLPAAPPSPRRQPQGVRRPVPRCHFPSRETPSSKDGPTRRHVRRGRPPL